MAKNEEALVMIARSKELNSQMLDIRMTLGMMQSIMDDVERQWRAGPFRALKPSFGYELGHAYRTKHWVEAGPMSTRAGHTEFKVRINSGTGPRDPKKDWKPEEIDLVWDNLHQIVAVCRNYCQVAGLFPEYERALENWHSHNRRRRE